METFTGEQPEAGDPSSDPVSHDPWMSVAMASHDLGMPEATPSHDPPIDQVRMDIFYLQSFRHFPFTQGKNDCERSIL